MVSQITAEDIERSSTLDPEDEGKWVFVLNGCLQGFYDTREKAESHLASITRTNDYLERRAAQLAARPEPELKRRLKEAGLGLTDADFDFHETDLYVLAKPGVREWLKANYAFPGNIQSFIGAKGSDWEGKPAFDIPFAGYWPAH